MVRTRVPFPLRLGEGGGELIAPLQPADLCCRTVDDRVKALNVQGAEIDLKATALRRPLVPLILAWWRAFCSFRRSSGFSQDS
jgi:hypothetical protein